MSDIDNVYCDEFCHLGHDVEQTMVLGAQIAKIQMLSPRFRRRPGTPNPLITTINEPLWLYQLTESNNIRVT